MMGDSGDGRVGSSGGSGGAIFDVFHGEPPHAKI